MIFRVGRTISVVVTATARYKQVAVKISHVVESCSDFTVLNETPLEQPTFEYFNTIWESPASYWLLKECVSTINSFCLEEWTDVISYFQNLTNDHETWLAHTTGHQVSMPNIADNSIETSLLHEKILFVCSILNYSVVIKVFAQIYFR